MPNVTSVSSGSHANWTTAHLVGLLLANLALAFGPFLVRLADTGPVAAGFWRLALALPLLALLCLREAPAQRRLGGITLALVIGAGLFFGLDIASWHIGIEATRLGNAALFGNAGSVILMAWGLIAAGRPPRALELAAIVAALGGAALLLGGSLEISQGNFTGDLLCILAGLFYAFYILMLRPARARLGQFTLLTCATAAGMPILLGIALMRGETIMPTDWTPLIVLALGSQVFGQGLLIYSLRHFPPLVIGLALLTQPAISAALGWMAFHETLGAGDIGGMLLLAGALVIARVADRPQRLIRHTM